MPSKDVIQQLAPTGTLRAGINMSNFLLVTGKTASGDPDGVSPDLAREIAKRLGVPVKLVPFPSPDKLVEAAGTNAWDIGLVGAEPQREKLMAFTAAYAEIEATYLVRNDWPLKSCSDVDSVMFFRTACAMPYSFTGSPRVPLDCSVRASDARNACLA